MPALRGMRQRRHREAQREYTERHVDREQPRPRRDRQNQRRHRRPDRERHADDQRIGAKPATQPMRRVQIADQRGVDAHDRAGAQALHDARGGEQRQRRRHRAAERAQREQRDAADIDAPMSDDIAERGERQQRRDHRELICVDDPDRGGRRRVQVAGDRGQRGVGDGGIERGERDGEHDRGHRAAVGGRHRAVGGENRRGDADGGAELIGQGVARGVGHAGVGRFGEATRLGGGFVVDEARAVGSRRVSVAACAAQRRDCYRDGTIAQGGGQGPGGCLKMRRFDIRERQLTVNPIRHLRIGAHTTEPPGRTGLPFDHRTRLFGVSSTRHASEK